MHESKGNLGVVVRLEHGLDGGADPDELARVAKEIAEHADVPGPGQLDEHHDVGAVVFEGGMHGMPRALPAIDDAPPLDALPAHVEREAGMADPLWPPLPRAAVPAALHAELTAARALPVRLVEAVGLRHGRGHPRGQVVRRGRGHATASRPSIKLDTGVTIGPEMTMETSASGTWLVDSPRICRTASITSSSPCM